LTYYWPPSGGSGVQRWMFFSSYLPQFNIQPVIITVEPTYASYKFIDSSFGDRVSSLRVIRTKSKEPFNLYSKLTGKSKQEAIPQGFSGESDPTLIQKISRFIRGNFFIPDARIGWKKYATEAAEKLILDEKIDLVITTGPPHSTHLAGLYLKKKYNLKWIADFRDPWTELYYNKLLYRTTFARNRDRRLESDVINKADIVLSVGPSMLEMLKSKASESKSDPYKFRYILNGFDESVFNVASFNKDEKFFTILHLGVLSDNQPIDGFVDALKKISLEHPDYFKKFKLKLTGKVSPNIINAVRIKLPDLTLVISEYLNHKEAINEMVNADLLFNSLADAPESKYLISGKLMEYITTGNPVLCLGNPEGDAAKLLSISPDAVVIERYNKNAIFDFVFKVFIEWLNGKRNSSLNILEKYTRKNTTAELAQLINKLQ
jgi:glycosyltransferase involved in cell wall biosynthesis